MHNTKTSANYKGQLYLDAQPELHAIVRDWVKDLDLNDEYGCQRLDEIECRGRSGFIPHRHNLGGFDTTTWVDLHYMADSSIGPNLDVSEQLQSGYDSARDQLMENYSTELAGIPLEKVNYHDLSDLGLNKLAETLDEYERSWNEEPVWYGVRAMYEGVDDNGVHTLMIYCSANVSEYYGAFGKGSSTLGEFTVEFKTVKQLQSKLNKLTSKVNTALFG